MRGVGLALLAALLACGVGPVAPGARAEEAPVAEGSRPSLERQPLRLALDQGWRLALAHSPGLQAARARVAQAREQTGMAASSGGLQATISGFREQVRTTPGPPTVLETYGMPPVFGEVGQGLRFRLRHQKLLCQLIRSLGLLSYRC